MLRPALAYLLAACFALSGCSSAATTAVIHTVPAKATEKCSQGLEWQVRMLDLKKIFGELAAELCTECSGARKPDLCQGKPESDCCLKTRDQLLVTDFVDLTTFEPKRVGVLLGEAMKAGLSQSCCRPIQQVELAKYFKLTDLGLVALTRESDDIAAKEYRPGECVIGTYTLSADKLMLFVRRVNLADGSIVRMVSREISFSCTETQLKYSVH